jgi:hypothetical protein
MIRRRTGVKHHDLVKLHISMLSKMVQMESVNRTYFQQITVAT